MIRRLDSAEEDFDAALQELFAWDPGSDGGVGGRVSRILADVRTGGDAKLLEHTRALERVNASSVAELALDAESFRRAFESLSEDQRRVLEYAADRIRAYHEHQMVSDWSFVDDQGHRLGQRVRPIARVGLYVPGGQASYPSTVLMTAIPALVAGVSDLTMVTPTPDDRSNPMLLAAAHVAGVRKGFRIGGAQAIGALAYGTETVSRVDKIVGPGGAYVAAAKQQVFGLVGIDLIAGPSEVCIVADDSAPVDWIVLDLFSQAEHDAAAQAVLISDDVRLLDAVAGRINEMLPEQPRRALIEASLTARGALILVRDRDEAVAVANRMAPEHLELAVREPHAMADAVRCAGAVFLGTRSPEVMGDYVAGPSHVLPTFGTARFSSPLGVYDFQVRSSVIELADGDTAMVRAAVALADCEGLHAHAAAAGARAADCDT